MIRIVSFFFIFFIFNPLPLAMAKTPMGEELSVDECAKMWPQFMPMITPERSRAICQCMEEEKKKNPLDADKGALLAGPDGMDNAGPWPNIFELCVQPALTGKPLPVIPPLHQQ